MDGMNIMAAIGVGGFCLFWIMLIANLVFGIGSDY